MIVKNRLLNYKDLIIYQDDDYFMFSLDSVLLANFIRIRKDDMFAVDFCTGNAPISMILASKNPKIKITGVELQKEIFELANRSINENNFDDKIKIINDDVKNIFNYYEQGSADIVFSNPPYFKYQDSSLLNEDKVKAIARHEIYLTLEDLIKTSSKLLKNGGNFYLVHRPFRTVDILCLLRKYNLEVKRLQFVYPKKDTEANAILIESSKNGKSGIKILPPLYVHNDDNSYTDFVRKMFE